MNTKITEMLQIEPYGNDVISSNKCLSWFRHSKGLEAFASNPLY
ncbi:MAG: hypothetical protein VB084_12460 [Syntrophomonadaceae bacterium]|nr:hypothetical protein [Syntrophomonadaceae bacterium]